MNKKLRSLPILVILLSLSPVALWAQGIKGMVKTAGGEGLPYTTVYIEELKTGTSSNIEGRYELALSPGRYTLRFQYIGYATQTKEVTVSSDWVTLDVIMAEQGLTLKEVVVRSTKEDAAYTIMRKAIAKAKYHTLQYDSFRVQAYVKGTGIVEGLPFLVRKKLEEEGLKRDEAYTSESVSVIQFKQPNTINETIVSIRTAGQGLDQASPAPFILTSFYESSVTGAVSPLSPQAFSYYRFEYLGSFDEDGFIINRIKVTPRSRGEQVFEGEIFIIEDLWAIHSLDLFTYLYGFKIDLKQNFAAVEPKVWMPVTQRITFSGSILGFKGRYEYLVSMSDYQVHLNSVLMALETNIIDEKIEEVPAEIRKADPRIQEQSLPENPDEMTRRQFRRMMNEYEKEQLKQQEDPEVFSVRNTRVDSLARRKDSLYWEQIRPIPLSSREVAGYRRDDSVAIVRQAEITGRDSLGVIPKRRFKPMEVLTGGSYRLGPGTRLTFDNNLTQIYYNTVEGFNTNLSMALTHRFDSLRRLVSFRPTLRYGFSSGDFYGKGEFRYTKLATRSKPSFSLIAEGGRFVEQLNTVVEPINPHINSAWSLLFRQNFMKIYEKDYAQITSRWRRGERWTLEGNLQFARRSELFNTTDFSIYERGDRVFTPNSPANIIGDTGFEIHNALLFEAKYTTRPFVRYYIRNNRRYADYSRSPALSLLYRKGIPEIGGSAVDFDHIELGIDHRFRFGIRGTLDFEVKAGSFLNNTSTYFMDFKHFDGNLTILSSLRPAGSFRLLDYYLYSTNRNYISAHTHYQFRKFLLTQLPKMRVSGMRENIFLNYLKSETAPHYTEIGYGIDNVFRLLRVEFAMAFEDDRFKSAAPRIGIATLIGRGID
jgi:hypothetical protein